MSGLGARNLGANNLNLNLNLDLATGSGTGVGGRLRFNTSDYRKLLDPAGAVIPGGFAALRFQTNWDPTLKTYPYLNEFIDKARAAWGGTNWLDHLKTLPGASTPPHALSAAALEQQVLTVLDRAADRDDRFAEIIDQHDADGCINYWLGMLMIHPARHPKTYLLIRVATRIGELVGMCLKNEWMAARPSQLCPGIVPMIDPPATPSYPAGHALQSRLITRFLAALDARRPVAQRRIPQPALLLDLSNRIAENRVIAGLHYPIDNDAGHAVADECFALLWPASGPTGALGTLVGEAATQEATT